MMSRDAEITAIFEQQQREIAKLKEEIRVWERRCATLELLHEQNRDSIIKLTTRVNEVVDGGVDTWTASEAHAKLVSLGMDCMRLALGMAPVNFDAERVRELISARIYQYLERGRP